MRLIDADAMIKRLQEWNRNDAYDKAFFNFTMNRINEQPTVEPPKGEWKKYGNLYFDYECSLCGRLSEFDTPFCQHCGARMKGE